MILLVLLLSFNSICYPVYAYHEQVYYARILFDQVYFYKTPNDDNSFSNVYFELPKTYFVELISLEGNFYQARYLNFNGYVKKDCVQAVSNFPNNPFLNNITFRVYAERSQQIWSQPSTKSPSSVVYEIPLFTKNVEYISKITGEGLIEGRTNIWYYCKFSSNKDYYGYVYSDFCDELTFIPNNTETVNYINNPTFSKETPQINSIPKDSNYVSIIITILCIPAIIFAFLVLQNTKIFNKTKTSKKEVVDY